MQNKTLQTKRALRTALIVLLLSLAGMTKGYAYDFSVVCETGQTLYYNIIDAENHYVTLTYPGTQFAFWEGFVKPTGNIILPSTVQHNGATYMITSVGYCAFSGCEGLSGSLIIPNSVTTIGEGAFMACYGFTGSLTIPNSVTTIGREAFRGCYGLTGNLTIPESVTTIEDMTFFYCGGFTGSLTIPNSVTTIGVDAFAGCSGLTGSLIIPDSIIAIGPEAFELCSGFTGTLTIPNSVMLVGFAAFAGCSGIEHIVVETGNTTYDSRDNCNAIIESETNTIIAGCKNTTIPNSVTMIGQYAFALCSGLTGSFTIPNSVTTIGEVAFYGCSGLTGNLTIGNSVTMISGSAFYGCSGLTSIVCLATTPPFLGNEAFSGVSCTMLTVLCGCVPAYEVSDWPNYFTTIEDDCASHDINIDEGNISGGSVSTSVNSTNMGEEVQIIVTPEEGMILSTLNVSNSDSPDQHVYVYPIDKSSLTYGFIMPPFDVVITATFGPATTIGENEEALASVYPNPTIGQIKIEAEDLKHITITNMLGQTIYDGNAGGDVFEYDFSKHKTGIYLIRVETASGVAVKKVSVTR